MAGGEEDAMHLGEDGLSNREFSCQERGSKRRLGSNVFELQSRVAYTLGCYWRMGTQTRSFMLRKCDGVIFKQAEHSKSSSHIETRLLHADILQRPPRYP